MVRRAGGDMNFAGAFMLLSTIGTVLLVPILAPLVVKGVELSVWTLVKPLFILVLLPLLIGGAMRIKLPSLANKLLPVIKKIGGISLVVSLFLTLILYGQDMLGLIGTFAPGALILFFITITVVSYKFSIGLKKTQRSSVALGMCTRNIAAVFAAYFGIMNPPPGLFVMIVLVVPLAAIVATIAAHIFSREVPETLHKIIEQS